MTWRALDRAMDRVAASLQRDGVNQFYAPDGPSELMLDAVGVERDAVIADYARTETLLPPERNARIVAYLRQAHPEARNLEELATRSPAPVMRELLDDLDARFGSTAGYLRAHGITGDELAQLRRTLVDESGDLNA